MNPPNLNFRDTTHEDLITGRSPWRDRKERIDARHLHRQRLSESMSCDVAIIGAGITGALVAECLTAQGKSVIVIDREPAGLGSTQASTALLQWEIDRPLSELTDIHGFETASHVYRRSRAAVAGLAELIRAERIDCAFAPRPTLYLASQQTGEKALRDELDLRHRAGLPGDLLPHAALKRHSGFDRAAAIRSPGSAEADPLALCRGLLALAARRGARLVAADALDFQEEGGRVLVESDTPHVVDAGHVVLATGYVMPHFVMPACHRTASTYAVATVPQAERIAWPERALVWEAADPYNYLRLTDDNRIIIGGEDEKISDPDLRDRLLAAKTEALREKIAAFWPSADTRLSHAWCGAFGQTSDGLPLIGRVAGTRGMYAAYGYGGNGITFSYLASRMIAAMISGGHQHWFDAFALDRDIS